MPYECTTDLARVAAFLRGAPAAAFDFETAPLPAFRTDARAALDAHRAQIVGISLSVSEGDALYIPLKHLRGGNADPEAVTAFLRDALWMNPGVLKIAHNLAFESMFLYALGIVLQPPCYDTLAAAQLTLKSAFEFRALSDCGLKKLVPELLGDELPTFGEVTGGRFFDELDPSDPETVRYACADADYALRLYYRFNRWFDAYLPTHRVIAERVESPTAVCCGLMKYNGLLADRDAMIRKQGEAGARLIDLQEKIRGVIGDVSIGANAGTQAFKDYLYRTLNLPVLKTTEKNAEAADDQALVLLSEWCANHRPELTPLFELVQEYRRWGKLKATYIDGYLRFISPVTGRIHPDLLPLATETGRFAARNPNLQNCFDAETEILTRRGFIPFPLLRSDDLVAEWDRGDIYFVPPLDVIAHPHDGDMIRLRSQHVDLFVTPDHRCLLQNRKNRQFFVVPAEAYCEDAKQLQAGQYSFGTKHLDPQQIALLVATQADGYYREGGIEFTFSKARKYRRLMLAVRALAVPYTEHVKSNGQVRIRLIKGETPAWIMGLLGKEKTWGDWLLEYDRQTIKAILAELPEWDGCFTRGNHYSSSVKKNADWMQILYSLTGVRAHLREYRNGNPNSVVNYQVDVTERDYSLTSNIRKETEPYKGMVYCVTVPSGYIVVRRGGNVCVTGNCPRKAHDPVGVRAFLVAPEGCVLLSCDFSQIELRVGAFYCRDEKMLDTYRRGGDIHAQTTSVIYGIPFTQAADHAAPGYKERRTVAKNCNFGVFYGLFPRGLQRTLKFKAGLDRPLDECEEIIRSLKAGYPALAGWQEREKHRAAARQYTETFLGRRRYLPGIRARDWGKKSFAERCALNTPIQGTAADILKLALGRILLGLPTRPWLKPLLQIHDELVFELPAARLPEAVRFVRGCMETQPFPEFDVPIVAEAAAGPDFGNLTDWTETEVRA